MQTIEKLKQKKGKVQESLEEEQIKLTIAENLIKEGNDSLQVFNKQNSLKARSLISMGIEKSASSKKGILEIEHQLQNLEEKIKKIRK